MDREETDAARLQALLHEGEQVVLLVKPRVGMPAGQVALMVLPGVLTAWLLVYGAVTLREDCWVLLLFGLPFWLMAAVLFVSPVWHRLCMARTLYVLTERRVLIFTPGGLRSERVVSMPLHRGLVQKVQKHGGYGDIVFARERRWQPGAHVYSPVQPVGFLSVPQPERVEQMIAAQVDALPPDAALLPVEGVTPLTVNGRGRVRAFSGVEELLLWGGLVCMALAFLLLMWGVYSLQREVPFARHGVSTYATIVSVRKEVSRWNSPRSEKEKIWEEPHAGRIQFASYYPTVQFTDQGGHRHTADIATPQPSRKCRPGARMLVCYNRANPQQVEPGRVRRRGMGFCMFSCMLSLIGVSVLAILARAAPVGRE